MFTFVWLWVLLCFVLSLLTFKFRRLAEALEIDDNSDPFNIRSSGPKYSDLLKEDARYVS